VDQGTADCILAVEAEGGEFAGPGLHGSRPT
jgi:hypothetical protein